MAIIERKRRFFSTSSARRLEISSKSCFRCRSCGKSGVTPILRMGPMPLANYLPTLEEIREKPDPAYPLELVFCPACSLVQITETVPPEILFREYAYFSSYSDTVVNNAKEIVQRLIASRGLGADSLAVEVASNDGYLLQFYRKKHIPVLGIEPAANIARVAEAAHGIRCCPEFFDEKLARRLAREGAQADVLHANNVLAHVCDLDRFVAGIRVLLKEQGVAVIEVPYVKDMIDRCEFDTIYHEHLCYFSLTALDRLFTSHCLMVQDVERIPIHGGSLRLFIMKQGQGSSTAAVNSLLEEERTWGVNCSSFYEGFTQRVEHLKQELQHLIADLVSSGRRIAAYGAAAKGAVLLNYCGIGRDAIDFVVDRNPHKQGRHMPGVRLPIFAPKKLLDEMPDYVLVLAWNLVDEIVAQQREFRHRGGRFIVPVPEPRII